MIMTVERNLLPKTLKETSMKKLMTLMLGLSMLVGATAMFAQDKTTDTTKTKKAKKAKKAKPTTTDKTTK
jgi:uncharacterized metal-binding protein